MDIIKKLAEELNIRVQQAQAAVDLIDEGNTICVIWKRRRNRFCLPSKSKAS